MGDFNLSVILDAIRRSPDGVSRVELAGIVGLAAQTVSNICRRLLDQSLIVEAGKYGSGPGKPRTILRLNPAGMYAIGVHLDPAETNFALLDLTGSVVISRKLPTRADADPQETLDGIAEEINSMIAERSIHRSKIAGLGVATPGPIDPVAGAVVEPPHMQRWGKVALRDQLQKAVDLPVLLDKDVTAAAVAEIWAGGASGAGSFIFVYMGTGIGSGLVLDDEVVRGSSGNAGEVGHIIADPDGPGCDCGQRGCVKVTCMPENIVAEARTAGVKAVLAASPDSLQEQVAALAEAAESGDEQAINVLDRAAERFAVAVSAQTNLLDVDHVVFGGPFWKHFEAAFLAKLPARLTARSATAKVHGIEVMSTGVGSDVGAVGAACLVLEDSFGPHAASLVLASEE
ncbi:ROK family transcriptional regulator [Arthrobacter russicus]|jgi:predicted NBD/HSP70 family sugar kinase|uniref:NBD/HSP70 family sugar kinase n=1 Tax=Arthrobacter russicus TaxID=172040 RepID=A0ABU1J9I5_9MICC|nr:ROK family transcriptional regulator [Arthrobacter russicus]MDR6268067.1 putative NBD/HSP70 family sugar kinase [Arthrobacter russicus]